MSTSGLSCSSLSSPTALPGTDPPSYLVPRKPNAASPDRVLSKCMMHQNQLQLFRALFGWDLPAGCDYGNNQVRDYSGGPQIIQTFQACIELCASQNSNDIMCDGVSYNISSKWCWMKTGLDELTTSARSSGSIYSGLLHLVDFNA